MINKEQKRSLMVETQAKMGLKICILISFSTTCTVTTAFCACDVWQPGVQHWVFGGLWAACSSFYPFAACTYNPLSGRAGCSSTFPCSWVWGSSLGVLLITLRSRVMIYSLYCNRYTSCRVTLTRIILLSSAGCGREVGCSEIQGEKVQKSHRGYLVGHTA